MSGYIAVDLDGTLAYYDTWQGIEHIGAPIPLMVERVKGWLDREIPVKIFTARVSGDDAAEAQAFIDSWSLEHIGQVLPVTCKKDFGMILFIDDRARQCIENTGDLVGDLPTWLDP